MRIVAVGTVVVVAAVVGVAEWNMTMDLVVLEVAATDNLSDPVKEKIRRVFPVENSVFSMLLEAEDPNWAVLPVAGITSQENFRCPIHLQETDCWQWKWMSNRERGIWGQRIGDVFAASVRTHLIPLATLPPRTLPARKRQ